MDQNTFNVNQMDYFQFVKFHDVKFKCRDSESAIDKRGNVLFAPHDAGGSTFGVFGRNKFILKVLTESDKQTNKVYWVAAVTDGKTKLVLAAGEVFKEGDGE